MSAQCLYDVSVLLDVDKLGFQIFKSTQETTLKPPSGINVQYRSHEALM